MSEERRHPRVANVDEVEARPLSHGKKYEASLKHLGMATGGQKIGCSWYELPPGKRAFPYHYHTANEEAMYVLEGSGTLRIGSSEVALRAGDYVTFQVGPDCAHQTINTGSVPLRYLCFSTLTPVEVVGYPDSNKFGASASASLEAARKGESWLRVLAPMDSKLGYYEGEED